MKDDSHLRLGRMIMGDANTQNLLKSMNDAIMPQIDGLNRAFDQFSETLESQNRGLQDIMTRTLESIRIGPEFWEKIERAVDQAFPDNWPKPRPDHDRTKEILEQDGIPIVHVPRAEIVTEIVDADTFDDRVKILETRSVEIAEDCAAALSRQFHAEVQPHAPLALRAVEAYQAGYHEAAQALAVAVCDSYLKKYMGSDYKKMVESAKLDGQRDDDPAIYVFNFYYPLAAIVPFLTSWFPSSGTTPPTKLSRHVSVHFATTDHMNKLNATVAIMLAASITVAFDKLEGWGGKRK